MGKSGGSPEKKERQKSEKPATGKCYERRMSGRHRSKGKRREGKGLAIYGIEEEARTRRACVDGKNDHERRYRREIHGAG